MCKYLLFLIGVQVFALSSTGAQTANENLSRDVNVEDLGSYLVDLDLQITRDLILPQSNRGEECLENMKKFWNNFRLLDGLVVLNEQPAFRPAKYMLEKECPKFVNQVFDVYSLQSTYKWDAHQLSDFKDYLLSVAGLAQKFPDDFSKMNVDVETLFEKPLVQEQ